MGILYVIGTPIGNLDDLTRRATRILSDTPLIAAEDTRITRRLLAHLGVSPRLLSCNAHNWRRRLPDLLAALSNGDAALVTDAGAPAVSDPGAGVVAAVAAAGHPIVSVPGVSAVTAALSVSGFPADSFRFLGFLPRRRAERIAVLTDAAFADAARTNAGYAGETLVVFESPHRLRATLSDIAAVLDDTPLAICRELTKLHEEIWRGAASDALRYFMEPRGEFTIVIGAGAKPAPPAAGSAPSPSPSPSIAIAAARQALQERRNAGMSGRDAVAEVAAGTGLPRRTVYRLWTELADSQIADRRPANDPTPPPQ